MKYTETGVFIFGNHQLAICRRPTLSVCTLIHILYCTYTYKQIVSSLRANTNHIYACVCVCIVHTCVFFMEHNNCIVVRPMKSRQHPRPSFVRVCKRDGRENTKERRSEDLAQNMYNDSDLSVEKCTYVVFVFVCMLVYNNTYH